MNRSVRTKELAAAAVAPSLVTGFRRTAGRSFAGFVFAPADPGRRHVVQVFLDGHPERALVADEFAPELAGRCGDACYGFYFTLPPEIEAAEGCVVAVRVANIGTAVGPPIAVAGTEAGWRPQLAGGIRWLGGLRFDGWLAEASEVAISVDGESVARAYATGWAEVTEAAGVVRSFAATISGRFADGQVHRLTALTPGGMPLAGCPVAFLAFPDGLAALVGGDGAEGERLRAELFDRLAPMSLPFSRYDEWRRRSAGGVSVAGRERAAIAAVMVGPGDMPATIASLGELGHADWVAAALPPTREAAGFRTAAAKAFLAAEAPDVAFVLFGHAGTVVMADAAERFAAAFRSHPDAVAAYGDLEVVGADGTPWPLCFPAFDYERMLEQGYPALFFALRRAAAVDALSAGAGSLFRLFNAVLDGGAAGNRVVHLPGAIARLPGGAAARCGAALAAATRAHLAARGIAAEVQPAGRGLLPAVRVTRQRGDLPVSVVVMARGDGEALRRCVASLTPAIEDCAADLVVVDDGSADPVRIAALAEIERRPGVRVVRGSAPAPSTARLRNLGAAAARHDAVCFIDDAVAARDRAWLRELASRAAAPDVAAVGALLVGEGGLIRAAGIVLGAGFAAEAAFADCVEGDPGYADMLRVAREVSALSAEAFLVRRSDLVAVGGFDEARFRVAFNEVDLALKLAALGRRIVFSPHARLTVHSRAAPATWPRREAERARDLRDLRAKWGEALLDDRLYSPLLALDARPFTALAMPPRPTAARSASAVAPRAVPSGF